MERSEVKLAYPKVARLDAMVIMGGEVPPWLPNRL